MLKHEPMNMNAKRSIQLLVDALLSIMKIKPFRRITIKELTSHAGVVRNTFYAHFNSKEEVLSYHIYKIFDEKYKEYSLENSIEDADFVPLYFEVWFEQLELLELLNEHDLLMTLNHLDYHFEIICSTYFLSNACELSDTATKYANPLYADGLASILKTWIRTGKKESSEELSAVYYELISSSDTSAKPRSSEVQ